MIFLRMCNVSISQSQRLRRQFSEGERESNMTCGRSAITFRNTKVQVKYKSSSQIQKFKLNTNTKSNLKRNMARVNSLILEPASTTIIIFFVKDH